MSDYKALAMARGLAEELSKRSALAVSESTGAALDPLIRLGGLVSANDGCLIRIVAQGPVSTQITGQAGFSYSPHVVQVGFEEDATISYATYMLALALSAATGAKLEVYECADGAVFVEADFVAANLESSMSMSLLFGALANS